MTLSCEQIEQWRIALANDGQGRGGSDELCDMALHSLDSAQAMEQLAISVLGKEAYDNSPCQAHPLELVEQELERLREELEREREGNAIQVKNMHIILEHREADLAAYRVELSRVREDAERYRWLRDHGVDKDLLVYRPASLDSLLPEELDAAIDTARALSLKPKEAGHE